MIVVKRLSILDLGSQGCLHDFVWSWRGSSDGENLSSLVRSFYQFAKEIDDGDVTKVKFASATDSKPNRHNRSRSRTGPLLSGVRKTQEHEEMYLHCFKGEKVIVAAFLQYSVEGEDGHIIQKFMRSVSEVYDETQPDSKSVSDVVCCTSFYSFIFIWCIDS
mmetsp:Transcript_39508/g.63985  ORF Transcript_39508/g.63985 Transcript_39508/m.63985 type:complete len:162 (+) Transcript_39508:32-517(+)